MYKTMQKTEIKEQYLERAQSKLDHVNQVNTNILAPAIMALCDDSPHNPHAIIGALLKVLEEDMPNTEKKEDLLKAGYTFCQKKQSKINFYLQSTRLS